MRDRFIKILYIFVLLSFSGSATALEVNGEYVKNFYVDFMNGTYTYTLKEFEHNYSNEIPASKIIDSIENGIDINYDNAIIIGDIDIENMSIKNNTSFYEIDSQITITRSIIKGNVVLANACFNKPIDFSLSSFEKNLDVSNSQLVEGTFFATEFIKVANFYRAKYNKPINFITANFYRSANFNSARFMDQAVFGGANFHESIFKGAVFDNSVDFNKAIFNTGVDFEGTVFNGASEFRSTKFYNLANFANTQFKRTADFSYTIFSGGPDLSLYPERRYIGNAQFYNTKFLEDAIFKGAKFVGYANFNNIEILNVGEFGNATFIGTLELSNGRINQFKARWDCIKNQLVYDERSYLSLIKNYKDLGWFEDADNCYYQYREETKDRKEAGISKLLDHIAWLSCGYGVRISHTFLTFFGILFLFSIYLFIRNIPPRREIFERIKEVISLSGLILISVPAEWYPFGKDRYFYFVSRHRYFSILERLLGWALMAIAILTLGKIMIR